MKMMTSKLLAVPLLLVASGLAQTPATIDNEQVRVLVAHEQPRVKTPLHEHQFNRVMIYADAGSQFFFFPNKAPLTINFKAGEVQWSPAGGMHSAEITSMEPV